MQLKFRFGADGRITDLWFDGLDENAHVTSVSEALTLLRVKNPATVFVEEAKAGRFDKVPDEEYYPMLHSVECISMLWRYDGDKPADKSTRVEVNVLTLLANAITMLTQQDILLREPPDIPDGPDFEEWPILEVDEITLAEIEEALANEAALDAWEKEQELLAAGKVIELDDFGNPVVKNPDDAPPDDGDATG